MKLQKQFDSLLGVLISFLLITSTITLADDNNKNEPTLNDVKKETAEAVEVIKQYSFSQRDEMLQQSKLYLEKLDARIDVLEETIDKEWDGMSAVSRKKTRELLKRLQKDRVELAELWGELKTSSDKTWDKMKERFSIAYSALSLATDKAFQQFEPVQKSNITSIYSHLLIAVIITLILFFIFMLLKHTGPWESKWVFFVLLFLFTWVGGIWLVPFGPEFAGVAILPFIYFGILFCLILASIQPSKSKKSKAKDSKEVDAQELQDDALLVTVFDFFLLVLLVLLILPLILHYLT